jgi:hypothetical protein
MQNYGDHLKLFGGSAVIMNLASQYQNTIEYRFTKDLDFYLYQGQKTRDDAIDELREALRGVNGYSVEVRDMRSGNARVIFTDTDTEEKIHADLQPVAGLKYDGDDIASLDELLRDKLILNIRIADRRFKDIVDVMTILKYDYSHGITKDKLLKFFEDDLHRLQSYLTEETLESQISQATKFKPQILNTDSVIEYANSFYELLAGVDSEDISSQGIFINGKWRSK